VHSFACTKAKGCTFLEEGKAPEVPNFILLISSLQHVLQGLENSSVELHI
jgi:hypothetical protein